MADVILKVGRASTSARPIPGLDVPVALMTSRAINIGEPVEDVILDNNIDALDKQISTPRDVDEKLQWFASKNFVKSMSEASQPTKVNFRDSVLKSVNGAVLTINASGFTIEHREGRGFIVTRPEGSFALTTFGAAVPPGFQYIDGDYSTLLNDFLTLIQIPGYQPIFGDSTQIRDRILQSNFEHRSQRSTFDDISDQEAG